MPQTYYSYGVRYAGDVRLSGVSDCGATAYSDTRGLLDQTMHLGARIRALRQAQGLRLSELARSADVTSNWLGRFERGRIDAVSPAVLMRLARVLRVTVLDLFEEAPPDVAETAAAAVPVANSSAAHNRALIEDLVTEVVQHGNLAVAELVLAPTYTVHGPFPDLQVTRAVMLRALRRLRRAFPDIAVTIDEMVTEETRVAVRWTLTGTHTGVVGGRPATGTQVRYSGMAIFGIQAGRITEAWMTGDASERALLWQLGLFPTPHP